MVLNNNNHSISPLKYIFICFLCRVKLEDSVDQLSAYDKKYETLNKWLKDTESKVRNESSLKPDLASKVDQSEVFMVGCSGVIYNVQKIVQLM